MKKTVKIVAAIIIGLIVIFFIFTGVSGFSFNFHPFFSSCLNLSEGMTKDEITEKMQSFLENPNYQIIKEGAGNYGWRDRLSYDESLLIVLENEPWYKLDQHPWQCEILFKNNLVIAIEPFFD